MDIELLVLISFSLIYFLFQWPGFFADGLVSILLALILTLGIEAPAINLEKCLLGRGKL